MQGHWRESASMQGQDVGATELALLASLEVSGIRKLIVAGEIETRPERDASRPGKPAVVVSAEVARAWLSGRGVAGL